jgi:hypothetical protein
MDHPPRKGFEFMHDLIQDMVQDDPKQRPTMKEVVSRYDEIVKKLSSIKLRSRVIDVGEPPIRGLFRSASHWVKQTCYTLRGVQPIPWP